MDKDNYRAYLEYANMPAKEGLLDVEGLSQTFEMYHSFAPSAVCSNIEAALEIKRRYGKNALVRGMNLQEAGTVGSPKGRAGF